MNALRDSPKVVTEFPPLVIPPDETKADRERRIFTTFAAYAYRHISFCVFAESIVCRNPPEPDILCEVCDHGPVAFELAEILDQSAQQMTATMMSARENLIAHRWALSAVDQAKFQTKFATKEVQVRFRRDRALWRLQESVPAIYEWLIHDVADDVCGDLIPPPGVLVENIELVSIGSPGPPFVDVAFSVRVEDATVMRATRKLRQHCYEVRTPVELLLYCHDQPFVTNESRLASMLAEIAPLVDASIARGHIRRVWVFSVAERYADSALKLTYPVWHHDRC